MDAGRQPAARHRRRRAQRIGHRGGEGAALLAAVGHATTSPGSRPRPARSCCSGSAGAIRLTPAGQLLADRAAEIIGRIDAAGAELSAHVGLNAGRVRLAGFASAIGSLVPAAVATLADRHPGLEISLTDTHPPEALELLRTGKVEVAIIFRYDETEPEPAGVRLHHLLDDPVYVLSTRRERGLAGLRDATWIAGCERCRSHLLSLCADAGFDPRIGYSSDDMVVMQACVAAGLGVATQTGLALRAHHIEGVVATELPGSKRHIYAATYGEPPDPPATAALLAALAEAAAALPVSGWMIASLSIQYRSGGRLLPLAAPRRVARIVLVLGLLVTAAGIVLVLALDVLAGFAAVAIGVLVALGAERRLSHITFLERRAPRGGPSAPPRCSAPAAGSRRGAGPAGPCSAAGRQPRRRRDGGTGD